MNLSFLIALLTGEAAEAAARARKSAVDYALAALAAGFGFVFLMIAAFVFVAQNLEMGALATALIFGGAFVLLALLVLLYHRLTTGARVRRARLRRQRDMTKIMSSVAFAALPSLLARKGGFATLLIPALAALGYAIYRENAAPEGEPGEE